MHSPQAERAPGLDGQADGSLLARVFRNERMEIACHAVIVALIFLHAASYASLQSQRSADASMDFLAFYAAGTMWREGLGPLAYDTKVFSANVNHFVDIGTMHWAYPPPMFLVGGLLSLMPVWLAYLCFMLPGYGLLALVVRRLAGGYAPGAIALALPAFIINARTGQTGFWIAALQGWFVLAMLGRRSSAGVPLGLLALKPHLGVGVGFAALVQRRFGVLMIAAVVVAALGLAATLALGAPIWPAYLQGTRKAGEMLAERQFPLARMTSIYAAVVPMRLGAGLSLAIHLCGLVFALLAVLWAQHRQWPQRWVLAVAAFAGLLVSPYSYDYDLVALSVVTALLLPDLCRAAGSKVLAAIMACLWLATFNARLIDVQVLYLAFINPIHGRAILITMSAPLLLLGAAICVLALRRGRAAGGA